MFNHFPAKTGRFRFRLHTLLSVFALSTLIAAWSAHEHREARRQREIAQELEQGDTQIQFGGPFDVIDVKPSDQPWHSKILGALLLGTRVTGLAIEFKQEPSELSSVMELTDLLTVIVIPRSSEERALQYESDYDLSFLSACRKLAQLAVDSKPVRDLTPLAGLSRLRVLSISNSQVSDGGPLASLTHLRQLELPGSLVADIAFVTKMHHLKYLELQKTRVQDLTPLASLTGLESLGLRQTPVSDLAPLAGLSNLKTLRLDQTRVTDLSPLAGLTQLERLSLTGTEVQDYMPLMGLHQLKELSIEKQSIDAEQLDRLKQALPNCRIQAI